MIAKLHTNLATPTKRQPLSRSAIGSGGSAMSSHVRERSMVVSCFRVIRLVLGPSVAASLTEVVQSDKSRSKKL